MSTSHAMGAGAPRHIGGWLSPGPGHLKAPHFGEGSGRTPESKGFPIAEAASIEEFAPPVKDQSSVGSCVENAILECYEGIRKQMGLPQINYSRQFLYAAVRVKVLGVRLTEDTGSTIGDGIMGITHFGSVPESEWPYEPAQEQMQKMPPDPLWAEAVSHRVVRGYTLDTLAWAQACITYGKPIAFGMPIAQSFMDVGSDGEIPMPSAREPFLGGHALSLWAFDIHRKNKWGDVGMARILNHWSTSWGDNGWAWMPLRFIQEWIVLDMHTIHAEMP